MAYDSYLGRVSKALILDAVREGAGASVAGRIAHAKKEVMVTDAEQVLDGKGWLPAMLRVSGGAIMRTKPHPEQGFRACLGILQLAKTYGEARLEAACQRGLGIGARTYGSIASILKTGLDRGFHDDPAPDAAPLLHANIRGRGNYH